MDGQIEIAVVKSPLVQEGFNVVAVRYQQPDGGPLVSQRLVCEWEPRELNEVPERSLHIDSSVAQTIMNSLWGEGVRPTDFAGGQATKALEQHLSDIKAILAKQMGVTF